MTRSQVRSAIRWEAIMIALFGTLGLVVGSFFGWASVRALGSGGVDRFVVPVGNVVVITFVARLDGREAISTT
jgi:putative ABC transport system permease protein